MRSALGIAISDEGFVTDDFSRDGRRVGWAPLDRASAGTLEMQGNDGLALPQWPIQYFEAALEDRVDLVTLHRTSGESSFGCSNDHLSLASVMGEEKQCGPSGGFKRGGVTKVRSGWPKWHHPSLVTIEDQRAHSESCSAQFDSSIGRVD
jgi:hypothetical protein